MIKQFTQTEILKMIPGSWSEVTLDCYLNKILAQKIKELDVDDEPIRMLENSIKIASVFIGFDEKIISKFPLDTIKEINKKLLFVAEKPKPLEKPKYKWIKKLEEPTYDTYITYIKVSQQISKGDFSNFPVLIKSICLDPLTDEEVLNLPMDEVETGFFFLRRSLVKYLKPSVNILKTQVAIERIMTKLRMRGLYKTK